MKTVLLLSLFFISFATEAQNNNNLPAGRYETMLKQSQNKWNQGDIILVDGSHYKITSSDEIGEYKFPKFVLTEGEMADVVEKYCEYHGFKLEPKNAPDQR